MFLLVGFAVWRFFTWPDRPYSVTFQADEEHSVAWVVDGDTLELENGDRVRLIGVDTPEFTDGKPEPFAEEATQFLRDLTEKRRVRLQFDRERFDKYRRVLAFVWVDDTLVNEEIVRLGYGKAMTQFGFSSRMKKRLRKAEAAAKSEGLRIWSN
jgi:micrococcal nuclease